MPKEQTIEIQKEFLKEGGKLGKYQNLVLGEHSLFKLLKYELIILFSSRVPGALGLLLRSKLYPKLLGRVGRNVTFGTGVILRHPKKIFIGDNVVIDDYCVLDAKGQNNKGIVIGNGVFLGRNTILNCKNGDIILEDNVNISSNCTIFSASEVKIGADYLIAAYCYIVGGTHRFDDPLIPVLHQGRFSEGIQMDSGGWLGAHVTVFDGVHIGKNVVIGAGSVVNKDITDYVVAAGAPIQVLKERKPRVIKSKKEESRKKRKILYLSMYDPHVPYTGAGVRGAQFVNHLARYYELDLVYMEGSGHPGNPELEEKFADRIQKVNQKIRIPFSQRNYFIFSKTLYKTANELLRENSYDYILTDYGLSARYGYKLSKKFEVPFIYCSHNIEYRQYLGKAKSDFRRWPLIPYVYRIEKKGCKKAGILVAISENDAQFYSKWVPRDKIVVIPQGFDDTIYNPFYKLPQNDTKTILFFGNYNISTNRDAVRVTYECIVDDVVQKFPNVKFQFVGANPPAQYSHPNFEFTGFVESMVPYIQKADLVISPILKGWGMPTKVIESLACGKTVIATEAAARSVPKKYNTLKVVEINNFADAIIDVLKSGNRVDSRDFELLKQEFTWAETIQRLVKKIEEGN